MEISTTSSPMGYLVFTAYEPKDYIKIVDWVESNNTIFKIHLTFSVNSKQNFFLR